MRCRKCGEVYRSEGNHQCSNNNDIIDTAIDIGLTMAIGSLFDSDDSSSNSSSGSDSSFDGFDGGSFGGGGSSSDY